MMNKINEYSILAYGKGRSLKNRAASIFKNEEGQGMVEYGLLIGLISVAALAVLVLLGPRIADMFQDVLDLLDA
jgi:pilus assembly protein Flp/PilA